MKVLHLLVSGNAGGIEVLLRNSYHFSRHENFYAFLWSGGQIADEMAADGATVSVFDIKKQGAMNVLDNIAQFCRQEGIDTVVSHNSAPLLKIALLYIKMKLPGTLTVAYAHANAADICEHKRKKGLWLRRLVHKTAFSQVDGIIAISGSVKRSLSEYLNVDNAKVKVIYNGVPLQRISRCEEQSDRIKLIYVGRLAKEKGVQTTIKALAAVADRLDFEFTIVGDGKHRGELEQLSEALSIRDKINFVGVSREVPRYLSESDIFIHVPVWEEGFGITVIEAMAAGCICICGDRGGIPEIITDGEDGYLVSGDSPESLAEVLLRIVPMYRSGQCEHIRENALRRVNDFAIEVYSREFDDFIDSLKRK